MEAPVRIGMVGFQSKTLDLYQCLRIQGFRWRKLAGISATVKFFEGSPDPARGDHLLGVNQGAYRVRRKLRRCARARARLFAIVEVVRKKFYTVTMRVEVVEGGCLTAGGPEHWLKPHLLQP